MSIKDLYDALSEAQINTFYGDAPDGTPCPFVSLRSITHPNILADDLTYAPATEIDLVIVEAHTRDFALSAAVERVLNVLHLPYTSEEISVPSEHVQETHYNIALYGANL